MFRHSGFPLIILSRPVLCLHENAVVDGGDQEQTVVRVCTVTDAVGSRSRIVGSRSHYHDEPSRRHCPNHVWPQRMRIPGATERVLRSRHECSVCVCGAGDRISVYRLKSVYQHCQYRLAAGRIDSKDDAMGGSIRSVSGCSDGCGLGLSVGCRM